MTASNVDGDAQTTDSAVAADRAASMGDMGPDKDLKDKARAIIKRHAAYGAAGGLIPLPLLDIAAASTIQMRMISQLAELYGVPFSEQIVKTTVTSLVASVIPQAGVGYAALSTVRAVPVVGTALGMATFPALYGAITYALGRTFASYFANGGTIENLTVGDVKERFKAEFARARKSKDDPAMAAEDITPKTEDKPKETASTKRTASAAN
ncbi:YcjF family protein [Acuticoccus kandeliae]|uniref:YcjF family protein n=1 Tax=Acuticoccus kandeliae TaxID=2073160 RepID=UPI000D3EDFDB|nr:DUF697 domain-containing protein [Acuticoccus kandeliae]